MDTIAGGDDERPGRVVRDLEIGFARGQVDMPQITRKARTKLGRTAERDARTVDQRHAAFDGGGGGDAFGLDSVDSGGVQQQRPGRDRRHGTRRCQGERQPVPAPERPRRKFAQQLVARFLVERAQLPGEVIDALESVDAGCFSGGPFEPAHRCAVVAPHIAQARPPFGCGLHGCLVARIVVHDSSSKSRRSRQWASARAT